MIIRIVKLSFHAEYISNFKTIFEENKQKIISQKGCNRLEMLKDIKDVNVIFTYSWWDYEDDLSQLIGDILAHRVVNGVEDNKTYVLDAE